MPGIAEGIPGAKSYDEVLEQTEQLRIRNFNDGKTPAPQYLVEPPSSNEHRASVLNSLGIGRNVTGSG